MGNQQSVANTINQTLNESINNVLMNSSNNCAQNNSATALITFEGIKTKGGCKLTFSDINQTINAAPNLTCAQTSANQSDLATQFQTQLDQKTSAAIAGIPGAINSQAITKAVNQLKNTIKNNINISTMANCVQNNIASATQNYRDIVMDCTGCGLQCAGNPQVCVNTCEQDWKNISQNLSQSAVAKCVQSNTAIATAITEASNEISQASTATNKGIDLFASFGSVSILMVVAAILFIVGAVITYMMVPPAMRMWVVIGAGVIVALVVAFFVFKAVF